MRGERARAAQNAFRTRPASHGEHPPDHAGRVRGAPGGLAASHTGAPTDGLEDMRRGSRAPARTERPDVRRAVEDRAGLGPRSRLGDSRPAPSRSSTKRWRRATAWAFARSKPNCIGRAGKCWSSATPPTPRRRKTPSSPPSRSPSSRARAVLSCARRLRSRSSINERPPARGARGVLAPALEGFPPTPETPEIAEAQALFEALAEIDDVRAATKTRHRRVDLQIALGNALIAARGYGAAETQASSNARAPSPSA